MKAAGCRSVRQTDACCKACPDLPGYVSSDDGGGTFTVQPEIPVGLDPTFGQTVLDNPIDVERIAARIDNIAGWICAQMN